MLRSQNQVNKIHITLINIYISKSIKTSATTLKDTFYEKLKLLSIQFYILYTLRSTSQYNNF